MSVDKNLFLYDLAVVSIMKNEARYVKEWLDYHLLAGVNHFFIYLKCAVKLPISIGRYKAPFFVAGTKNFC